jgi:hypothetical protein
MSHALIQSYLVRISVKLSAILFEILLLSFFSSSSDQFRTVHTNRSWPPLSKTLDLPPVNFFFNFVGWGETVHLVSRPRTGLLYQPRMMDKYGVVGGMRTGRGNRSTWSKPAPLPLCSPQIPHDLTLDRTRAAEVGRTYGLTCLPLTVNFSSHSTLHNVDNLNRVINSLRFCQSLTPNAETTHVHNTGLIES